MRKGVAKHHAADRIYIMEREGKMKCTSSDRCATGSNGPNAPVASRHALEINYLASRRHRISLYIKISGQPKQGYNDPN